MTRILIADDEERALDLMEKALLPVGHPVDRAQNGREAMELLSQNDYDILVTDLVMPQRTGLDLVQTLRMRRIMIPIIVLSAFVTPDVRRELEFYERVEILSKPVKPEDLVAAVRRALAAVPGR